MPTSASGRRPIAGAMKAEIRRARTPLADGLGEMYRWYCKHMVDVAA